MLYRLLYTDDDAENVEESRMTVSAAWGRRGSASARTDSHRQTDREKIALDINILKKQYDKLRERQKQAHIILTTACTRQPARQPQPTSSLPLQMNKLLIGKNAIISKGRRPPTKGAIPPVRVSNKQHTKPSKPVKHVKEESKTWKEKEETRRHSMKWHDIKADRASSSGDPFCSAYVRVIDLIKYIF